MSFVTKNFKDRQTQIQKKKPRYATHLRVLVLRQVLIPSLQLLRDLVPLLRAPVLDDGLHDAARVMLEDDVFDLAAQHVHECADVLGALRLGEVLLSCERPGTLRLCE